VRFVAALAVALSAGSCEAPDLVLPFDLFAEPGGACAGGPERSVVLCEPSVGREERLAPAPPNRAQQFVHLPGLGVPSFGDAARIPSAIGGHSVDEFLAAHPGGFAGARFADLDGDGDLDVVSATAFERILVWRNRGDGTFARWQELVGGDQARTCDLDGDGDVDVVSLVRYPDQSAAGILVNDGRGELSDEAASRVPLLDDVQDTECADLDGDGAPDLLVATWTGPDRVTLNDGRGFFGEATELPGPETATRFVLSADLDGDQRGDAVFGGVEGASRIVLDVAGAKLERPLPVTVMESGALGDVDGDGDLDLALRSTSRAFLLLNDAGGGFSDATDRLAAATSGGFYGGSGVNLGDFDMDGDLDVEMEGWSLPVQVNTLVHPVDADAEPPSIEILEPADNAVAHAPPRVRVRFSDAAGIDPTSVRFYLGDEDISADLTIGYESADGRPGDVPFAPGENLVVVEARDVAGNGLRRTVSFRLDAATRPFAAHLVTRDADGHARSSFAPGEYIELVLQVANGGAASLAVPLGCGGPNVRVLDRFGNLAWLPFDLCLDMAQPANEVPPCSESEFARGWDQGGFVTDEQVPGGTYTVRTCFDGSALPTPPEIEVTIE
jgi:hypothetical protein